MDKVRLTFNKLPSVIKVMIYTGASQVLGILLSNINNSQDIDVRAVLGVLIGIIINILGYLVLREKNEK